MKKVILVSLCVLLAACGPVFGYWVKGKVVDVNGNGVSGATVYIDCYSAKDGNSYHDTRTSIANGDYAGGWLLKDCDGGTMVVKAVKGNKSGSLSWVAGGLASRVDVGQDVTIKTSTPNTGELHCQPEPVTIIDSYTMVPVPCIMFAQAIHGPILVNGGTATLQYDPNVMYCAGVEPCSPFNSLSYYESPPGTIHVNAYAPGGVYIPVQHGDNPTTLFTLNMVALDYTTPGVESFFDVFTEISIDTNTISGFPARVELVIGDTSTKCKPYFRLDTQNDWQEALSSGHVYAMDSQDWGYYMLQWQNFTVEGEPYPDVTFKPARPPTGNLYVYGGGGGGGLDPCDAGLVMLWGDGSEPDGEYASAYRFDYLKDPDLSNCTISVAVTAPTRVGVVSFGLENPPIPGGPIRSWYWNCGAAGSGAPIIWNTPTVITIDTTKTGRGAATPTASSYMNNPGFNIKNVQWLIVDEDSNWIGPGAASPAPGSGLMIMWNYWHWLTISPKTTLAKGYYTKWSQPPVVIDANMPPTISGWDEMSNFDFNPPHVVADDWECNDSRPITDIHWWGSFLGWTQPYPPPVMPQGFHIGIWTDVPDPDPCDHDNFSHPGTLVWENYCNSYVWNFAGYDKDPRDGNSPNPDMDSCFQFNQLLSQDEWFYQEPSEPGHPRVYWLSIAPIWGGVTPTYGWGWKSRPHFFNDDAVVIQGAIPWAPPVVGSTTWTGGYPIQWPAWPDHEGISWDMAFELSTNEPDTTYNAMDFNKDGNVDFLDFAVFAQEWLKTGP